MHCQHGCHPINVSRSMPSGTLLSCRACIELHAHRQCSCDIHNCYEPTLDWKCSGPRWLALLEQKYCISTCKFTSFCHQTTLALPSSQAAAKDLLICSSNFCI